MPEPSSFATTTSISLLERVRGREPEAWRRLSAIYGPLAYQWSRRCGLAAEDAADIVQEVFAVLAERINDYRGSGAFRGWLWMITRNKINDHWRRGRARVPASGGTTAYQQLQQLPADAPEPWSNDEEREQTEQGVTARTLEFIRAEFEPKTWQAFWLATVEKRTAAEIAAAVGLTKHAVHQAKYRVLRRLRDEFEGIE